MKQTAPEISATSTLLSKTIDEANNIIRIIQRMKIFSSFVQSQDQNQFINFI